MRKKKAVQPKKRFRYYQIHPDGGGPVGLVNLKPKRRAQDRRAKPADYYAVVFFPKITGIGNAQVGFYELAGSLSQSPQAAIAKFMDRIRPGEKWETYHNAGHRVRRLRITDLGEPRKTPAQPVPER